MTNATKQPTCDHLVCKALELDRCLVDDPVRTTPAQLRAAREAVPLTQEEAGSLVHKHSKGGRTWRRWEAGERGIDETVCHLFALLTGLPYPFADSKDAPAAAG